MLCEISHQMLHRMPGPCKGVVCPGHKFALCIRVRSHDISATFSRFLITFRTSPDYLCQYFTKAIKNIRKVNYEIDLS